MMPRRWLSSLQARFALLFAGVAVVALIIVYIVAGSVLDEALVASAAQRLEVEAGLVVADAAGARRTTATDLAASDLARVLGGYGTAVAIVDQGGSVLGAESNGADPAVLNAALSPAEYASVIAENRSVTAIVPTAQDGRVLVVAAPIQIRSVGNPGNGQGQGRGLGNQRPGKGPPIAADGPPNAVAQLAISLDEVDAAVAGAQRFLQLATLGLLVVAGFAVWWLIRIGLRPLERVARAADQIAAGDHSARASLPDGSDEVGRLGRAFDGMAERVDSTLRAQRAFAADASHEIRSPLTVLGGYIDVLARDAAEPVDRQRTLAAMRREVDRLSRLSEDLLLLTQLEAGGGRLAPREIDLGVLVEDIAGAARVLGTGRQVVLDRDGPLPVSADPDRMTQALMNLVDNAVRHTSDADTVLITARRVGEEAVVTVANSGEPIPTQELPRVFERFYRAGGASGDSRHAGLGLAIVKAIVEASGGSVSATSDESATRFSIRMPLHA